MNSIPLPSRAGRPECANCSLRAITFYGGQPEVDIGQLAALREETRHVDAGKILIQEGEPAGEVFTIYSGWAFRYKILPNGRRQILSFMMDGDFLTPTLLHNDCAEFSIRTLTPVQLCVFGREGFNQFMRASPQFGAIVERNCALVQRVVDLRVTSLGQRSAYERLIHLVLELFWKARHRGMTSGDSFAFPLRRAHIADALGLTEVHVGRVMKQVSDEGLIQLRERTMHILRLDRMLSQAGALRTDLDIFSEACS
jgi:CRP/FNR family transcriptional regulator